MTPYFSGGSTLDGTPGGDKWARVLYGQIGWLSEPLLRFDAGCSGSTNEFGNANSWKARKIRPTQNTPLNPQQPGDATTSRRRAKTHVPRVSSYSPASIDTGFVEIGLVQLSHSVKTTNVTRTLTDTQTNGQADRQTN